MSRWIGTDRQSAPEITDARLEATKAEQEVLLTLLVARCVGQDVNCVDGPTAAKPVAIPGSDAAWRPNRSMDDPARQLLEAEHAPTTPRPE